MGRQRRRDAERESDKICPSAASSHTVAAAAARLSESFGGFMSPWGRFKKDLVTLWEGIHPVSLIGAVLAFLTPRNAAARTLKTPTIIPPLDLSDIYSVRAKLLF